MVERFETQRGTDDPFTQPVKKEATHKIGSIRRKKENFIF
jgi:hypothetical protein